MPAPFFATVNTGRRLNAPVQVTEALGIVTVMGVDAPTQPFPPVHPAKKEPDEGVAVNTTGVFGAYGSEQSCVAVPVQSVPDGAEIPTGCEVTVPVPVPFFTTVKTGRRSNVAVQVIEALGTGIVTVIGVVVPVQSAAPVPVHPTKMEVGEGVAVKTTGVPGGYGSLQSLGVVRSQIIPTGWEVTVPVPLPFFATVKTGRRSNVALQVVSAVGIVTVAGVAVPVQPVAVPVQRTKIESGSGVAVNTTGTPGA